MKTNQYFVLDTNIIVSAVLLKPSLARQAFNKAFKTGNLLFSLVTFNELNKVLMRKKFDKYVSEKERLEFLTALAHFSFPRSAWECRGDAPRRAWDTRDAERPLCIPTQSVGTRE